MISLIICIIIALLITFIYNLKNGCDKDEKKVYVQLRDKGIKYHARILHSKGVTEFDLYSNHEYKRIESLFAQCDHLNWSEKGIELALDGSLYYLPWKEINQILCTKERNVKNGHATEQD